MYGPWSVGFPLGITNSCMAVLNLTIGFPLGLTNSCMAASGMASCSVLEAVL